ncbi:16S rRNA methyltransferase [Heyndrickxia shackletonii]|uniref:16S rRNA methyltransferase n=1 Tax=Heyndrickxia shackletonii TaxID=157838 RepID=A0A0Q3TER8_9BACI|nr:class I SAM-dependent methyltransferase [Heyndrickxia shackletonii]KQL52113.1 16S rRNA methyltransferase [Heyndrickxia shackletonii]MBB2481147.1 class I SAM-dependent methyltransferase [Bacillus sp. APMAM]NEZ01066.1 class I SAM-dependent methyltransferase [Heyndrickxia shackletonii]RTZ55523.1 class I SAM-dependent methyltransferase [Bacillus sp. SAJ1]
MSEHYYSRNPEVESKPVYWNFTLRGNLFRFKTDQGVFSKSEVDFGSRLLIENFAMPEIQGPILDVGCGYGPIGLSIAKSEPDCLVHMVDVNQRAIELARENASSNQIPNVEIYESDRFENVSEQNFSAIVTNPPIRAGKKIVHEILTKSYEYLLSKGELWVVIQKKQGAPSAKEKMSEIFDEVEVVCKDKGYYILKAKKG